ncbi:hypothetical protein VTK73DRAFT_8776 [Phialemonium thermophilum]|uniref:Uncharacterized protein n=1 Tax=Phialemonium thermophilum TaxID=223376 RepID=A0ABR3XMW5_9PEZI
MHSDPYKLRCNALAKAEQLYDAGPMSSCILTIDWGVRSRPLELHISTPFLQDRVLSEEARGLVSLETCNAQYLRGTMSCQINRSSFHPDRVGGIFCSWKFEPVLHQQMHVTGAYWACFISAVASTVTTSPAVRRGPTSPLICPFSPGKIRSRNQMDVENLALRSLEGSLSIGFRWVTKRTFGKRTNRT